MPVLKILTYPNPILKKKAVPVEKVTAELSKFMDDMAETMYAGNGVGLAAPQVGVSLRIITVDAGDKKKGKTELIQLANPEIVEAEGEIEWEEGCLSVPEFTLKMKRKSKITVTGLDKKNKKVEYTLECLAAVAIQHEIDHLDGKLLIDKVSSIKREMYLKKIKKTVVL